MPDSEGDAGSSAGEAAADEGDLLVFPNGPVKRLSDYVRLTKLLQTGNMNGALAAFDLDMASYAQVLTAWGQKLASNPKLGMALARMMAG